MTKEEAKQATSEAADRLIHAVEEVVALLGKETAADALAAIRKNVLAGDYDAPGGPAIPRPSAN